MQNEVDQTGEGMRNRPLVNREFNCERPRRSSARAVNYSDRIIFVES
jgi:hypothetical protein